MAGTRREYHEADLERFHALQEAMEVGPTPAEELERLRARQAPQKLTERQAVGQEGCPFPGCSGGGLYCVGCNPSLLRYKRPPKDQGLS